LKLELRVHSAGVLVRDNTEYSATTVIDEGGGAERANVVRNANSGGARPSSLGPV